MEYVLIVLIWYGTGDSTRAQGTDVTTISKFTSEKLCEEAGRQITTAMMNNTYGWKHMCLVTKRPD